MVTFCQVCRAEIPPERVSKKARTCSDECQKQYRTQMRSERAEKACRLCGRKFRQRRSSGDVLMEHNEVTELVRPTDAVEGVNAEFSTPGVSAALTSERQEQSTPKAVIESKETSENFSRVNNLYKNESFTTQSYPQGKVEELLTVGAELPVESRPQVDSPRNAQSYAQSVEMSQNEVMG